MPRYLFRIKAHGGRTRDLKQIKIPDKNSTQTVIYNANNVNQAKKLARKQNDGTFWLMGMLDENDKLHKLIKEE